MYANESLFPGNEQQKVYCHFSCSILLNCSYFVDRALVGHVIQRDYVTGSMACLMKCNDHVQCRSVNFEETPNSDDSHRCELNDRKVGESSSSGLLAVHPGFSFYELEEDMVCHFEK